MLSIILFIVGFLTYYVPYLVYLKTLDFFSTMFVFIFFAGLMTFGNGVLYEDSILHRFVKNKNLNILSWGITFNGFIIALLFSINPFLSIFSFFFLMMVNILTFKNIVKSVIEEWNNYYEDLTKYRYITRIEEEKKKLVTLLKYLKYSAIFSGGLLYIIQFLKFVVRKLRTLNFPAITYFDKNLKKAKGFEK